MGTAPDSWINLVDRWALISTSYVERQNFDHAHVYAEADPADKCFQ